MLGVTHRTAALARQVREDERGFTLVEMLTGIMIATLVIFAAYSAVDAANRSQLSTANRVDAVNRARNGMESISRAVRSQQCFNGVRPMLWASGTGMEFYSSVGPIPTDATKKQPVERHRIEWIGGATGDYGNGTAAANTFGDIWETVYRSTADNNGVVTWPTKPTSRTRIAEGVSVAPDRRDASKPAPIFRYFKYASTTGSGRVDLTAPVGMTSTTTSTYNPSGLPSATATDLAGIVLIEVSYQSVPRKTRVAPTKALNFYNTISVRIADPTNPAGSPQCL